MLRRATTLLLIILALLCSCGAPEVAAPPTIPPPELPRSSATTWPPQPATTPLVTPTAGAVLPTALPMPAPLPPFLAEQQISITLSGRTWHLAQPISVAPVVAHGNDGILWIAFPQMRAVAPPAGDGLPRPLDAYFVMYTPLTEPGDNLSAGYRIAPLASATDDAARSLVALTPLEHNRFLLVSRRICQGCQNGGTLEFWRIGPSQYGQPEAFVSILELPDEGGGHFLTFASSPRWLLWSAVDLPDLDPAAPARPSTVELLDLQSGRRRTIAIDEPYGVEQAKWGADSRFHLIMRQTHHRVVLDPDSQRVTRANIS